jgi:hypothetical protein
VEDDGRRVLGEDLAHPLLLLAVRDERGERRRVDVAVLLELALDREEVVLGVVDEHEPARADAGDLAAQLRADRAAGAGDEHDQRPDRYWPTRSTSMRTGSRPRTSSTRISRTCRTSRPPVCSSSNTVGMVRTGTRAPGRRRRPAPHGAGSGGNRDQHLVGLHVGEHPPELLRRPEHLEAVHSRPSLARVVVDEADGPIAQGGIAQDLAQQQAVRRPPRPRSARSRASRRARYP